MADEDYDDTPHDNSGRDKRNGGTLVTLAIFGVGILLLITLLYFAY